jgi:hypothetical protein
LDSGGRKCAVFFCCLGGGLFLGSFTLFLTAEQKVTSGRGARSMD